MLSHFSCCMCTVINYFHSATVWPLEYNPILSLFRICIGLFLGFSVISLVEIIYFFSIRPICALKRAENEAKFKRNYVSNIRGVKQSSLIATHANIHDHYMYQAKTSQSACEEVQSKLISGTRYIKAKVSSVWNSIVELSENEMGGGQMPTAPYPYLD